MARKKQAWILPQVGMGRDGFSLVASSMTPRFTVRKVPVLLRVAISVSFLIIVANAVSFFLCSSTCLIENVILRTCLHFWHKAKFPVSKKTWVKTHQGLLASKR